METSEKQVNHAVVSLQLIRYLTKAVATGIPRTLGSAFIALTLIPLIMRNVGTDVYGAWTLLFIFVGLSSTLNIGIPKGLVYLIPKEDDKNEANSIFSASAVIVLILMTLVVAIGAALICFRVPFLGNKTEISPSLNNLLLLSGVNIVCCGLISSLCQSLMEARYKIHFVNIIFFFRTALHYISVFLVSVRSTQIEHLIYATNLIFMVFVLIDVSSVIILTRTGLTFPRWRHIKTVLLRGKDFFLIGSATSAIQPLTRYLVALLCVDIAANGVYDISLKIAMMATGVLTCFSVPLFSLFSGFGEKRIKEIKHVLSRMTCLLAVLFVLGVSVYLFIGERILEFAFGEYDARLFNTSLILLIGCAFYSVFEPYIRALWGLGHTKKCIAVRFGILSMTIILFFALYFIDEPLYRIGLSFVLPMLSGGMLYAFIFYRIYGFRSTSLIVSGKTTSV